MTIKKSYLKLAGLLLIFGTILFLVIGPLLPRLIDISTYQQQIVTLLEDSLKRKISLGGIRFAWRFGPRFVVDDLHLRERTSTDEFLSAQKVTFRLGLLPLLRRQVVLRSIMVDGLQARIVRQADGTLNIDDLLQSGSSGIDVQVRGIRLHQGRILWLDLANPHGVQQLQLSNIDLRLGRFKQGKNSSYRLSATLDNGTIKSAGSIRLPAAGEPLATGLSAKGTLTLVQVDYRSLWAYYGDQIPFGPPGGTIDAETQLKGTLADFTAHGLLRLNTPKVVWPGVFRGPVAPKQAQLRFDLQRTPDSIDLSTLELDTDGFSFSGSLKLSDLQTDDPYLSAKGVSKPFEYQQVRFYIPFGIIDDDAADFIENKIASGRFNLKSGTLEGRLSKLARFDEGDNPGALFISGAAENVVINYDPDIPSFSNISGELEMKGRHFNLYRASGSFGGSPFTLQQGSITDYCTLGVPSTYPFTMEIAPKPAEVAWLAQLVGADQLKFSGPAPLQLTGSGPTNAYRLAGNWQLANAAYSFPDVVKKPAGMPNSLSFSSLLDRNQVRVTALSYNLAPLQLSGLATFQHNRPTPHLDFELQSNSFMLSPQLPIMTGWQRFQPTGTLQAHVKASGDPRNLSAMLYNGSVWLGNFSVRPMEQRPPLTAINGQVTLKGNSLETTPIAVRYGRTALQLRAKIPSLKAPEPELVITSAELQPADFGVGIPALPPIRAFSANLGFNADLYTIHSLSGQLPHTSFNAAGTVRPGPVPALNLRLSVAHLNVDEILPFLAPEAPAPATKEGKPVEQPAQPFTLHGYLSAESGNYGALQFNNLQAQFGNQDSLFQLHDLQAGMLGGHLAAKGHLERISGQPHRWFLDAQLKRIQSDELLHSLGIDREISGLMQVKGSLRARGDSLDELKRTAGGVLELTIERGQLRRFSTLAKVFSLLNVSQLLTLQLPDMVSEGMPFNQITATVGVKDGILSSQDFFINSNAMHLSMVGKINIVKEDLDLLIGVQPLQTVDKVISRIPVVGWILTGGDGSLITTYFEAKGTWADPQVSAIPVKSIAGGTLNIFRRVFELPVRVFTDSGEVFLGSQKERPKATDGQVQ